MQVSRDFPISLYLLDPSLSVPYFWLLLIYLLIACFTKMAWKSEYLWVLNFYESARIQQAIEVPKWNTCTFTLSATLEDRENSGIPKVSFLRLPVVYDYYPHSPTSSVHTNCFTMTSSPNTLIQTLETIMWQSTSMSPNSCRVLNLYKCHYIQQFFRVILMPYWCIYTNNSKHLNLKEIPSFPLYQYTKYASLPLDQKMYYVLLLPPFKFFYNAYLMFIEHLNY